MQRRSSAHIPFSLLVFLIACAALVGYLVVWFVSESGSGADRPRAVLGASSEDATPTPRPSRTPTPPGTPRPTPTFVVAANASAPPAEPTSAPPAVLPTEAPPVPTEAPPTVPAPTETPVIVPPTVPAPTEAPPPVPVAGSTVRLEETAWRGGWQQSKPYGGRNATWIYGTGTGYSSMQAAFVVDEQPSGMATLTIEGMDSEDRAKTPISIGVNGTVIYSGPNPLPNDDQPLDSGTWASYSWNFDAQLVQPGTNILTISTRTPGQFRQPPFFMLDYAVINLP